MIARFLPALLAAMFAAGCAAAPAATPTPADWLSGGPRDIVPIVVSSDLSAGTNRFLLNVVDPQNQPLAAADRQATMAFYDLSNSTDTPAFSTVGTYMSVLPRLPGLYRAQVEFSHAGQWGLQLTLTDSAGGTTSGRLSFPVRESSSTPAIGAAAPATDTPTATTTDGIHAISTDADPDPDFYRTSVKQALAGHLPFLLIFATPAFCRSATCGPALDVVKGVAAPFKDRVTFIHVEPYQLRLVDGALQPVFDANNDPIPIQPTLDWGLPTEPYTFVVDTNGKVRAKLEGIAGQDEIRAALALVAP